MVVESFDDTEEWFIHAFTTHSEPACQIWLKALHGPCTVLLAMFRAGRPTGAETWFWAVSRGLIFLPERKRSEGTWAFFPPRMLSCRVSLPKQ
ncbi:hypothetical protein AVEN_139886-1 [Araneus ventricosus]|uniref:Uncharacterized protein n=1 Tax=Araneus ventricosus TaxID=182803 RepID=A0A4Y2FMM9_ARAVE|nr:hypothetical protein AVEN_139886-1 [Araneus ventricosus]